jgi:hypothetical protein
MKKLLSIVAVLFALVLSAMALSTPAVAGVDAPPAKHFAAACLHAASAEATKLNLILDNTGYLDTAGCTISAPSMLTARAGSHKRVVSKHFGAKRARNPHPRSTG